LRRGVVVSLVVVEPVAPGPHALLAVVVVAAAVVADRRVAGVVDRAVRARLGAAVVRGPLRVEPGEAAGVVGRVVGVAGRGAGRGAGAGLEAVIEPTAAGISLFGLRILNRVAVLAHAGRRSGRSGDVGGHEV